MKQFNLFVKAANELEKIRDMRLFSMLCGAQADKQGRKEVVESLKGD